MTRPFFAPDTGELNLWSTPEIPVTSAAPMTSSTPIVEQVVDSAPKVYQVSELTRKIRDLLEGDIGSIWIEGEISNHRRQSSGHQYFTLKDASSQIACVLFRGSAAAKVDLSDGMHVEVYGDISVYEARGQYQLVVRKVSARGAGALQAKFEALKARLHAEGLFDEERKRELPLYPKRIGIVTSPTAAALRDFLRVVKTRMPAEFIIAPVRVQGTGAAKEIVEALSYFADQNSGLPKVDAIAVIRGGGSLEDLWEFNEEIVARAIAASPIPVVTGIGHEIDFTIADFAADYRAPTPSAAAAALLPERSDIEHRIMQQFARLRQIAGAQHQLFHSRLQTLGRSGVFREPARRMEELTQNLDDSLETLGRFMTQNLRMNRANLDGLIKALHGRRPTHVLSLHRQQLAAWLHRLQSKSEGQLAKNQSDLKRVEDMLRAFSPQATLERGFTMTTDAEGNLVASAEDAKKQDILTTIFKDGKVRSKPTA